MGLLREAFEGLDRDAPRTDAEWQANFAAATAARRERTERYLRGEIPAPEIRGPFPGPRPGVRDDAPWHCLVGSSYVLGETPEEALARAEAKVASWHTRMATGGW